MPKIILYIAVIAAAIVVLPFIWRCVRLFFKRMSLWLKIRAICRKNQYKLVPTHAFWVFGDKNGRVCDFYIETPETVYAVKLFAMPRRKTELHFTDEGKYYIRSFIALPIRSVDPIRTPVDSKHKPAMNYDFRRNFNPEWHMKRFCPVLLINPVSADVRYVTRSGSSEVISAFGGAAIYSLSRFISELEAQK